LTTASAASAHTTSAAAVIPTRSHTGESLKNSRSAASAEDGRGETEAARSLPTVVVGATAAASDGRAGAWLRISARQWPTASRTPAKAFSSSRQAVQPARCASKLSRSSRVASW
jgi:hypothetical protein